MLGYSASRCGYRMGLSSVERAVIWGILYFEIVTNVINGLYSLYDPIAATQPMFTTVLKPGLEVETARWFGAVSSTFGGYGLWRALSNPAALKFVLEVLCVGDFLYLGSLTPAAAAHGQMPAIAAPYVLTLIMFLARIRMLLGEDWAIASGTAVSGGAAATDSGKRKSR